MYDLVYHGNVVVYLEGYRVLVRVPVSLGCLPCEMVSEPDANVGGVPVCLAPGDRRRSRRWIQEDVERKGRGMSQWGTMW